MVKNNKLIQEGQEPEMDWKGIKTKPPGILIETLRATTSLKRTDLLNLLIEWL